MPRVRGEYIRLGEGAAYAGGGWSNLIDSHYGVFSIAVTEDGTTGVAMPYPETFGVWERGHVRLICDTPMIVVIGGDVAQANSDNGFILLPDVPETLPIKKGDRMSFVTVANY